MMNQQDGPSSSTNAAGPVVEKALRHAKEELKKNMKQLLIENLGKHLTSAPCGPSCSKEMVVQEAAEREGRGFGRVEISDSSVAKYLRERGYEYTLSVLMAEANVPDSKVLKSISSNLRNDTRSRLVAGNPDFQNAILRIWEDTETRYNELLRNQIIDWEMKQKTQLKQMERILRSRLADEEREMRRQLENRSAQVEAKEKESADMIMEKQANFDQRLEEDKRRILDSAKDLDEKRRGLQSLETELRRQVDSEQDRIRRVKADLNELSVELKRQQVQLTFQMDEAVKEARRAEQDKYAQKLQLISKKEQKLREMVEKAKTGKEECQALKRMLLERDRRIQELEMNSQRYKLELSNFRDKLREKETCLDRMGDYDRLKMETSQLNREKRELQKRNYELESKCNDLLAKEREWNPGDDDEQKNPYKIELASVKREFEKVKTEWRIGEDYYRKQLDQEKTKNEEMKEKLDAQTERLGYLSEVVKKLHHLLTARAYMMESGGNYLSSTTAGRRQIVSGEIRRGGLVDLEDILLIQQPDQQDDDEPTPDYLKEAKRRLRLLERETESFEQSLSRYRESSIDTSSLAAWQARILPSASSTTNTALVLGGPEPAVRKADMITNNTSTMMMMMDHQPNILSVPPQSSVVIQSQPDQGRGSSSAAAADGPKMASGIGRMIAEAVEERKAENADADAESDWERKLREREEERMRMRSRRDPQDEEEEDRRRQESLGQEPEEQQQRPEDSGSASASVDPVLQRYMRMVMEQREREKLGEKQLEQQPSSSKQQQQIEPNDEDNDHRQSIDADRSPEAAPIASQIPAVDRSQTANQQKSQSGEAAEESDFEW